MGSLEKYALNRIKLKSFNKFYHLSFLPMGKSDDEYEFNNGYPLSSFYWISITLFIIWLSIIAFCFIRNIRMKTERDPLIGHIESASSRVGRTVGNVKSQISRIPETGMTTIRSLSGYRNTKNRASMGGTSLRVIEGADRRTSRSSWKSLAPHYFYSTDDEDVKKSDSSGQPTPTQSVSVETSDDIEIEI